MQFLVFADLENKTLKKVADTHSRFLACDYLQNFINTKLYLLCHLNMSALLFVHLFPDFIAHKV